MEIFEKLSAMYPALTGIFTVLYCLSVAFKLLSEAAQKYVDQTIDVKDNEILVKVEKSLPYRILVGISDVFIRFKPPVKKEVVEIKP